MRRVKKKPPKEFSKKILIVAGIINAVVIVFTMVMIWRTLDLSPLAYLIPVSYTHLSARMSTHPLR